MLKIYLLTLGGVALAQIAPGANLLAVAGAALRQDLFAAIFLALGVATATLIWVTMTTYGLATLLTIYPSLLTAMKLLGGGYLCLLALKALHASAHGRHFTFTANRADLTPFTAWRRGLLINLTNPKSALTWGAVATFMFGSGLSAPQVLAFAPIGAASALTVYSIYGLLFSSDLAKRIYTRFTCSFQALFGMAFGALGGKLLADVIGEISQ